MMAEAKAYADIQPIDGEIVLFCEHVSLSPGRIEFHGMRLHWYMFIGDPSAAFFNFITGETEQFDSRFTCICEDCALRVGEDIHEAVAQHAAWIGNEPIILKQEVN